MTTSNVACPSCGEGLRATAKFCDECGSQITATPASAEYKQVTVLFADVVRSMDIAAAVGAERLREIMGELIERAATVVQNAALIAEHLKAAGDLHAAFDWYMRAGTWLTHRNLAAARASWRQARDVADRVPATDADRPTMRIAPRTLLCASSWLAGGTMADTGFDELRDLATAAGDKISLAMAMAGWLPALIVHARFDEASRLASELESLLDSIGDPNLILGLLYAPLPTNYQRCEMNEALRIAERTIELADGDATKGNLIIGSPLTGAIMLRGCARCFVGDPGWKADVDQAVRMVRAFEPALRAIMLLFKYNLVPNGVWLPDADAVQETAEMLEIAERSGDDLTLACARYVHGVAMLTYDEASREDAFVLLAAAREAALQERFTLGAATLLNLFVGNEKLRTGDFDSAIELLRPTIKEEYGRSDLLVVGATTAALVRALLNRGGPSDLAEAQETIDRLAAVPTEPDFVLNDLWLLQMRAFEAEARGDEPAYRDYRDRYRAMANSLGFEGHIAWAQEMP
jgi:adenylate cyclase